MNAEQIAELRAEVRNLRRNLEAHIFGGSFRRPFVARLSVALDGVIRIEELLDEMIALRETRAA